MLERNADRPQETEYTDVTISFIMENRISTVAPFDFRFEMKNGESSGATVDIPFSIFDLR